MLALKTLGPWGSMCDFRRPSETLTQRFSTCRKLACYSRVGGLHVSQVLAGALGIISAFSRAPCTGGVHGNCSLSCWAAWTRLPQPQTAALNRPPSPGSYLLW